ncbi:SOS response-associated peptidase family protein, partial [Listeria seeligeri]|uniref:SOS response-associated peptidase family protein n=1 Tax=Listeria seeligeri TaxID=1640 RepID=UPI0022EA4CF0
VSPEDGKKDPWFIHATGPLLAAGLWEDTSPLLPNGNLGTFTIITGDSSGVSADIHDRMPVWLQAGQIDQAVHWLKRALAHGSPAFMANIVPELAASPHPQVRALVAPP